MNAVIDLIRSPTAAAAAALDRGRLSLAALAVSVATVVAAANVARSAAEVSVQDVMFGSDRSPLIDVLLSVVGRDLTAVVLHLVEESWNAVLVVTALGPLWLWLLGASAIHAAARLAGDGRPFRPILVMFGIATGVTRALADLVALVAGGRGAGAALAEIAGIASLVWLGALSLRGIARHYSVDERRAVIILALAVGLFYLVPLALIVLAVIAILVAAVALDYFPTK